MSDYRDAFVGKREECIWTFDDGQYISTCDPDKFINISPAGMTYCPYCGRPFPVDGEAK